MQTDELQYNTRIKSMSENNTEHTDQTSTQDISTQAVVTEKVGSTDNIQQKAEGQTQEFKEEVNEEKKQQKEADQPAKEQGQKEQHTSGKKKKGKKKEQVLTITAKELKLMSKKIEQLDLVKQQYEKMRKNYQILRSDRDQHKTNYEQVSNNHQNSEKQLQRVKLELSKTKQQKEQLNKQQHILNKKIEEYKKVEGNKKDLEERIKQLENIIDMTTSNLQLTKKAAEKIQAQSDKYKQLLRLQKESNSNIRNQLEKLRLVESETFVMKQQLVRIGAEYKNLKAEKEQLPMMIDKFQHQERMIKELKDTFKQTEVKYHQTKSINQKMQKKIASLLEEKKQSQKKIKKLRIELEQSYGQVDALKMELEDDRSQWQVQKKRYTTEIRTLKTELHKEHEKLIITEWQLSESKKKEKKPVQIERVNVMDLSKEDMLNLLQEMEMKNQAMKLTLESTADTLHHKDNKLKQQQAAIMALARQITKDYPNYHQSQGMQYVEKDIIEIGRMKKDDWGEIVEKVMIQNLRLKYSVTALGEEYNQKLRKQSEK